MLKFYYSQPQLSFHVSAPVGSQWSWKHSGAQLRWMWQRENGFAHFNAPDIANACDQFSTDCNQHHLQTAGSQNGMGLVIKIPYTFAHNMWRLLYQIMSRKISKICFINKCARIFRCSVNHRNWIFELTQWFILALVGKGFFKEGNHSPMEIRGNRTTFIIIEAMGWQVCVSTYITPKQPWWANKDSFAHFFNYFIYAVNR